MPCPPRPPSFASLLPREGESGRASRRTIALLLDYLSYLDSDGAYQSHVLDAFHSQCRLADLNLLVVYGRALHDPAPHSAEHNRIFDLVGPHCCDGVVVCTVLGPHCSEEVLARFARRFAPLPVVSHGLQIRDVPSVMLDNGPSMEQVLEHIVSVHGCRRIAFIKGNPGSAESEQRFAAYRRCLERNGIPYDPALVTTGHFVHWSARDALRELLQRARDIDAVVAANDMMALGGIEALRELDLRVPDDVVVTGFDDIRLARLGETALTTVAQPYGTMACQVIELLSRQMQGHPAPDCVTVRGELRVRRSCGCGRQANPSIRDAARITAERPAEYLRRHRERLLELVDAELIQDGHGGAAAAGQLLDALASELDGQPAFLDTFTALLGDSNVDPHHHQALLNALNRLRAELAGVAPRTLDLLWCEALNRVAHSTVSAGVTYQFKLDHRYLDFVSVAERMSSAFDLSALEVVVTEALPSLGLSTAFVSLVADEGRSSDTTGVHSREPDSSDAPNGCECGVTLVPFVQLVDAVRCPEQVGAFPATRLVPRSPYPHDRQHTWLVFPLVFEAEWLGVGVFEYQAGGGGYALFRDQLVAAIGTIILHQKLLSKTRLHERSLRDREATARRMRALSVLAGGVAHDLNNTLGPLVALPDIIVEELARLDDPGESRRALPELREDVMSIKAAGVRAAHTIKDLLTLGRRGRATREPLDLNRVVDSLVTEELQRPAASQPGGVRVTADLHPEPLIVAGSEAHIVRAFANLVRNAVEATTTPGKVVVRTGVALLTAPHHGYETIEPGDYAVVSVIDEGAGIDGEAAERIFEPFFSSKRVGEHSGSGLGLAIVHSVVKEHDGFVDVTSARGKGATFSLYFPRTELAPESRRELAPIVCGNARVLVVDDDPIQGRTARRVLGHLGYQVDVLNSGAQALDRLRQGSDGSGCPYQVVIMDMMLSEDRNGLEILAEMRRRFPQLPALIVSGRDTNDRAGNAAEGIRSLAKPYTAEDLASAVQAVLDMTRADGTNAPGTSSPG